MYKYQKTILNEIEKARDTIEDMTEEQYMIKIGTVTYDDCECELYMCLNHTHDFKEFMVIDGYTFYDSSKYAYDDLIRNLEDYTFSIDNNVFLKFNKLIDKVIKDNINRENFYNALDNQLKAFNKAIKVVSE